MLSRRDDGHCKNLEVDDLLGDYDSPRALILSCVLRRRSRGMAEGRAVERHHHHRRRARRRRTGDERRGVGKINLTGARAIDSDDRFERIVPALDSDRDAACGRRAKYYTAMKNRIGVAGGKERAAEPSLRKQAELLRSFGA